MSNGKSYPEIAGKILILPRTAVLSLIELYIIRDTIDKFAAHVKIVRKFSIYY